MNAAPTTSLRALIDLAFDNGVEIVSAPLEGGMVIVKGAATAVAAWFNEVPPEYGIIALDGANSSMALGRLVLVNLCTQRALVNDTVE